MERVKFVHTADWQIGKPFAGVRDPEKRLRVRLARIEVIERIGQVARERGAAFVVVAGDLFDSPTPEKATVSEACAAIGRIGLPVYAIPGNHDHGGPGTLWEQAYFQEEREALAPNLTVLLEPGVVQIPGGWLLASPLSRRQSAEDPARWMGEVDWTQLDDRSRIALLHGTTQGFVTSEPEEEDSPTRTSSSNRIALSALPEPHLDYIALGDWHGCKQVGEKAWYAGTPEFDRFAKGEEYEAGHLLVVEVERGELPRVDRVKVARLGWHRVEMAFEGEGVERLEARIEAAVGERVQEDLLLLQLEGRLGMEEMRQLEAVLAKYEARLLRVKYRNRIRVAPAVEELDRLLHRPEDPLIARVSQVLLERMKTEPDSAEVSRMALRLLYGQLMEGKG